MNPEQLKEMIDSLLNTDDEREAAHSVADEIIDRVRLLRRGSPQYDDRVVMAALYLAMADLIIEPLS